MPDQQADSKTLPFIDLTDGTTSQSSEREPLMNIAQVAERLGVTVRHMRRLVTERRIPYIKWGHLLRFEPAEVDRFVELSRVERRR